MKRKKVEKCSYGYINWKKKEQILATLYLAIVAGVIFIGGYLWNGNSEKNIFTVFAILLLLPAARHLVEVIILFPYRTPTADLYEQVKQTAKTDAILFSDYVFTSQEKVMFLSSLVVQGNEIIGLTGRKQEKTDYIKEYLMRSMKQRNLPCQVAIYTEREAYLKRIARGITEPLAEDVLKEVVDFLRASAV